MNFKSIRFAVLVAAICMTGASGLYAEDSLSKKKILENPYYAGAFFCLYDFDAINPPTPAPKGYRPIYISHYGRHGARYLESVEYIDGVMNIMHRAHSRGKLTPYGERLYSRLGAFMKVQKEHLGQLSDIGIDQHRRIAENMVADYPDVFKVGVAGGPVIDWKWYEVMYGERYMDTPQTNPEGYEKTSLLNKAKDLKGRLQIIIGMNDDTVVPQHALQFLNQCAEEGTQPDFYVYPGEEHNMRGHKSTHLHERITRYFDDFLK